jgi:poly-gamma-glutamate synthase PgsB/CapB
VLFLYVVFVLCCFGLLVAGIVEQRNHETNLFCIPHRVLVNGIRGKSSITRLCAGALRGGGKVVVAKTTGTAARLIYPDATEEPVYRKFGIANVVEQIGIVRRAAAFSPDVLVIECMAVAPALQELNQTKLIQSTIGVLSNVREDHVAEMGPTLEDIARSLSRSMPVGGVCVTAERERLPVLVAEARRRRCQLIVVDPASVTDAEMSGFAWMTFKENVAIALAVAHLLGVPRGQALEGMWATPPDPGVLTVTGYRHRGGLVRLANIFAANDPESTLDNIAQLRDQGRIPEPVFVIINCRPDRIERNGQMGGLIAAIRPAGVVLIGEPTRSARVAVAAPWQDTIIDLGGRRPPAELLAGLLRRLPPAASLVAVGNIHGQGEVLLAQLATLEPTDSPDAAGHGDGPGAPEAASWAQRVHQRPARRPRFSDDPPDDGPPDDDTAWAPDPGDQRRRVGSPGGRHQW